MRLTFFGNVSFTDDAGKTVTVFRTQKMVVLLALLALRQGYAYPREELLERLWPEQDYGKQRARLRNEISLLSHLLGPGAIQRDGNRTICLASRISSDLADFDAAVGAARHAKTRERRVEHLRTAVVLQQAGEFMPGFYEEDIVAARVALRADFHDALACLIRELRAMGNHEGADYWTLVYRRRFPSDTGIADIGGETENSPKEVVPLAQKLDASPPMARAPVYRDRFFGREAERQHIEAWKAAVTAPLLTITGPPGVGKTRLAVQVVPDAVFVSLAEVSEPKYFWEALALALSGQAPPNAREYALQWLKAQETLLILDNFEHIAEDGAEILETVLASAPRMRCIVTSRVRLAIGGEEELHLSALPADDGRTLFLNRARAMRQDFQDSQAIDTICTLLEGVPLALELAATHAATLSAEQMAVQLQARLTSLAGARRDFSKRHRSLRAAFEQSFQKLPNEARRAFLALSTFWGTFTLEDATELLGDSVASVPDTLQTLRAHSLLQVKSEPETLRYRLLFALREFGRERQTAEDAAQFRSRHARAIAAQLKAGRTNGEYADIDAALVTLKAENVPLLAEMALALQPLWEGRGLIPEGIAWTRAALAREIDATPRARLKVSLSALLFYAEQFDAAEKAAHEAVEQAEALADVTLEVSALRALAHVLTYAGKYTAAGDVLQKAGQRLRTVPDGGEAHSLFYVLGVAALCVKEFDTARFYLTQAEHLARQKGDLMTALLTRFYQGETWLCAEDFAPCFAIFEQVRAEAESANLPMMVAYADWGTGLTLLGTGNADEADPLLRSTFRFLVKTGHQWGIPIVTETLAYCACAQGRPERATILLSWAERRREELRFPRTPSYTPRHEYYLEGIRQRLTPKQFNLFWQSGSLLSLTEVHALALEVL